MRITLPFAAPAFIVLVFTVHITKVSLAANEPYRVVCYYTNWAQYRPEPANFVPENINPYMCTHLVYAFASLEANQIKSTAENDESNSWTKGMFTRFNDLKRLNPHLKTLLAIGGWPVGSAPFSQMASQYQSRRLFIESVINFLRGRKFDGLDINWEYPVAHDGHTSDKERFTLLVQELSEAFKQEAHLQRTPRLLLTGAVSAVKKIIDNAYDVPMLSKYLDFITVTSYDLHGPWDIRTGHNSPLYSRQNERGEDRYLNVAWAAHYWIQKGAEPTKLNIGMATYARTFTLNSRTNTNVGALIAGAGKAGFYTKEKGLLAFFEVCNELNNKTKVKWVAEQLVPYAVTDDQWIGYDNPTSVKLKSQWLKQNGFGGASIWTLDMDDFLGKACNNNMFPLTTTVANELNGYLHGPVTPKPTVPTTTITTTTSTMRPHTTPLWPWRPPLEHQRFSSREIGRAHV